MTHRLRLVIPTTRRSEVHTTWLRGHSVNRKATPVSKRRSRRVGRNRIRSFRFALAGSPPDEERADEEEEGEESCSDDSVCREGVHHGGGAIGTHRS